MIFPCSPAPAGRRNPATPFLPSASVDRVFAMNVIYFLEPLDAYLAEIFRCLKPGGLVVLGVKDVAIGQDKSVYVNQDWSECLAAMKRAGFEAELGSTQLEGMAAYRPLIGRKKDAVTAGS